MFYLQGFLCQQLPMPLDCDRENNYRVVRHAPFGYYQAYPTIANKNTTCIYKNKVDTL